MNDKQHDGRAINDPTINYVNGLREVISANNVEDVNNFIANVAVTARELGQSIETMTWTDGRHRVTVDLNEVGDLTVRVDGEVVDVVHHDDPESYAVRLINATCTMRERIATIRLRRMLTTKPNARLNGEVGLRCALGGYMLSFDPMRHKMTRVIDNVVDERRLTFVNIDGDRVRTSNTASFTSGVTYGVAVEDSNAYFEFISNRFQRKLTVEQPPLRARLHRMRIAKYGQLSLGDANHAAEVLLRVSVKDVNVADEESIRSAGAALRTVERYASLCRRLPDVSKRDFGVAVANVFTDLKRFGVTLKNYLQY